MTAPPPKTRRAEWLGVLAQSPAGELQRLADPLLVRQRFEWLRRPEQGLAMVRARIGHTGDRFNLGEATVTRCALRHLPDSGEAVAGIGYVLGRDALHAERVARLDALLQRPGLHDGLWRDIVEPLRTRLLQSRAAEQARTDTSRVRFFTLQPEAGA
jgi:alpha-D-ribose 1-methylphosphonate 5-triphosphate synthase subunit PhnG